MARKPKRPEKPPAPPVTPSRPAPEPLTDPERTFALEYLARGGRYTRAGIEAYRAAYPNCTTDGSAAVGASRLLKRANVRAFLEKEQRARWKRLEMEGDEVMALIAIDASVDVRDFYDKAGNLKPFDQWPEESAAAVRGIMPTAHGTRLVLNDKLRARQIIAEVSGKLKNPLAGAARSLARILAGDFDEDEDE